MQSLAIVVLSVLAAISYGIVHDQITARVCIEYFMIGHPQVLSVPTSSPNVIGFVWGTIATWWVGLGFGIGLALAARLGIRRKRTVRELVRPIAVLLLVTGTLALCAGIVGYVAASVDWISVPGRFAASVPQSSHAPFIADLFAHRMSYMAGVVGGLVVVVQTWHGRKPRKLPIDSDSQMV